MKFSLGVIVIVVLAVVSAVIVAWVPSREPEGIPFGVFTITHYESYATLIARWNEAYPEAPFNLSLLRAYA